MLEQAANPLGEALERQPVDPTALVIFGATGDLARRKLLPAIYNLAHDGALPERFALVGASRRDLSDDQFRGECAEAIRTFSRRPPDPDVLAAVLQDTHYVSGGFNDAALFEALAEEVHDEGAGDLSGGPPAHPVAHHDQASALGDVDAGGLLRRRGR